VMDAPTRARPRMAAKAGVRRVIFIWINYCESSDEASHQKLQFFLKKLPEG
jgi:hypothetical protein